MGQAGWKEGSSTAAKGGVALRTVPRASTHIRYRPPPPNPCGRNHLSRWIRTIGQTPCTCARAVHWAAPQWEFGAGVPGGRCMKCWRAARREWVESSLRRDTLRERSESQRGIQAPFSLKCWSSVSRERQLLRPTADACRTCMPDCSFECVSLPRALVLAQAIRPIDFASR